MSTWDRWNQSDSENKNENQNEGSTQNETQGRYGEDAGFDGANYYGSNRSFEEESDVYKTVMKNGKPKTMGWSVASMVLGILSLVCCCIGWTGAIFGIAAIVFSVIARKSLGYFDGMAIAGLVCGIFGFVFGAAILLGSSLIPDEFYEEFYKEYEQYYNNGLNQF